MKVRRACSHFGVTGSLSDSMLASGSHRKVMFAWLTSIRRIQLARNLGSHTTLAQGTGISCRRACMSTYIVNVPLPYWLETKKLSSRKVIIGLEFVPTHTDVHAYILDLKPQSKN